MIDYESLAEQAAGNWKKFESFGWRDRPEDGEDWTLVYTHNRDSGLRELSNAQAIKRELKDYLYLDIIPQNHGHWGNGWVAGYAIRVYDKLTREVTPAFKAWCDLAAVIEENCILDSEGLSQREYDAAINAISQNGGSLFDDEPEKGWEDRVFGWLDENDPSELEAGNDGAYPSRESIREALEDMGLIEAQEDEEF